PAPTGPSVPLNQPTDSLRHSLLTRPHAGVWRKLTEGCAALNSRCRSASMVRTERATDENLIVGSRMHAGSHGFVRLQRSCKGHGIVTEMHSLLREPKV